MFLKKWKYNQSVYQLLIDFRNACNSVSEEILYNIVIGFGIDRNVIRLINLCLTETCSRLQVGKHLSDVFPIKIV